MGVVEGTLAEGTTQDAETTLSDSPPRSRAAHVEVGSRVARYVVLKKLGSGGMGVVYLAYDEDLDRRVALKLLAGEVHASEGASAASLRLLREAQAMAKLSHPNVVAMFDVGTFGEQVFLAMEYVDGMTLRAWREAAPRTTREIVSAYVQAGRGLEAAHAAGILHRDFKPENAVVDARGRVRVLDFGVAQLDLAPTEIADVGLAPTLPGTTSTSGPLTHVGALLGTPGYMAPEQLRGERAEPRSDEFAFCVALYEALFGERPYEGKTLRDLLARISLGRLDPPRSGAKVSRGLRAAIVRGLSPARSDRFSSMKDLLDALEREIATRRRYAVMGLAAAGAAAIGVLAATRPSPARLCVGADEEIAETWGPAPRAAVRKAFDESGSPRAVESWEHVLPRLDAYTAAWAKMRTDSCEATRVRGMQSDEALDLRAACLDQRRNELAATVGLLAKASPKLVDDAVTTVSALTDLSQCADVPSLRAPYAQPHDPEQRRAVEAIRKELAGATALVHAQQLEEAEAPLAAAIRDAKALGNRQLEAEALVLLGNVKDAKGETDAAYTTLRDAAFEANVARDDAAEAEAWTQLAFVTGYKLDRASEGDTYVRLAEAAIDRAGPTDARRARLLRNRGHLLYGRGEHDKSLPLYREALALFVRAYGERSLEVASVQEDVADDLFAQGKMREAMALYESAIATISTEGGESHPRMILSLSNLSIIQEAYGDGDGAVRSARHALATVHGKHGAAVEARLALARGLVGQGELVAGELEMRDAIAERERMYGEGTWWIAADQVDCAQTMLRRHLTEKAAPRADQAIAILSRATNAPDTLREARQIRAICLARLGRAREALPEAERALADEDRASPSTSLRLLLPLLAVGEAALASGEVARAVAALERASAVAEAAEGYPEYHADIHAALARALVASRADRSRAAALAERAAREYEAVHLPEPARRAREIASSGHAP